MAVAAERYLQVENIQHSEYYVPQVIEVAEMYSDELIKRRAAAFIGAVLLEDTVEVQPVEAMHMNLMDAIHEAQEGNQQALNMVRINAATDVMERTFKAGHITEVSIEQDSNGTLFQYGQPMQEVYANSFRYMDPSPCMSKRLEAEALNGQRIQTYASSGLLEDYAFVVFSLVPDEISTQEAQQEGFFTDTMSGVIQVTTKKGDEISVESAFVAGRHKESADRHDIMSVGRMLAELGLEYENASVTDILSRPILIHKDLLPRGVVDLVEHYDRQTGSFFGQKQAAQSYDTYKNFCQEREASMQDVSDTVADRLVAAANVITSPTLASALLNKYSEEETLQRALTDMSIDPEVYGYKAAEHIITARSLLAQGNIIESLNSIKSAKETAVSSSCAGNLKQVSLDSQAAASEDGLTCKEVKDGARVKCPGCMKVVRAIVPNKETIYCSNKRCKLAHPSIK